MEPPVTEKSGPESLMLSRRSLLKLGVAGSVALSTTSLVAGLAGCGKREQAVGARLPCSCAMPISRCSGR